VCHHKQKLTMGLVPIVSFFVLFGLKDKKDAKKNA
jgi:hypothetical protein